MTRRNIYLDEVDMCTVIFLLDDATGIILKIAMMREPIREVKFSYLKLIPSSLRIWNSLDTITGIQNHYF